MTQRIMVLTRYFFQRLVRSVSGALYLLLMLGYWYIFFNPQQETPDVNYFILVIGAFGALVSFMITLTIANWANQAIHYPFLVRLPSRVEYLTAVFLATLSATVCLQLLLALLALLFQGPAISVGSLVEIPPLWLAPAILFIMLALHASDLVASGWSRVYLFGMLAIALFSQQLTNESLIRAANGLSQYAVNQGWQRLVDLLADWVIALSNNDTNLLIRITSALFWPFNALIDATVSGAYLNTQVLAPAIFLLYAAILFILAADLFTNKDLAFTEA